MAIQFTVLSEPVGKARARVVVNKGKAHSYTPSKTSDAENNVRWAWLQAGRPTIRGPICLTVTFYRTRPKSTPKNVLLPVTKPDTSNYLKLVEDALNNYAFQDDSYITTSHARKRFGSPPRIEIELEEDSL